MKKTFLPLMGIFVGGVSGYFYWQQIGCSSGTCVVTSRPLNSTLYGAIMGYLIIGLINDLIKKR